MFRYPYPGGRDDHHHHNNNGTDGDVNSDNCVGTDNCRGQNNGVGNNWVGNVTNNDSFNNNNNNPARNLGANAFEDTNQASRISVEHPALVIPGNLTFIW